MLFRVAKEFYNFFVKNDTKCHYFGDSFLGFILAGFQHRDKRGKIAYNLILILEGC